MDSFYTLELNGISYRFPKHPEDKDKYIVFVCAKNEDRYMREYVSHYLDIGFDKIIIADNNDDTKTLETILADYVEEGTVELFNCSGMSCFQDEIYTMFMQDGNYAWCAYFDADEYLELNGYHSIKDALKPIYEKCVCVHWLVYGNDGHMGDNDGPVQERFRNPIRPVNYNLDNQFIKSIVRGGKTDGYFTTPHYPEFNDKSCKYNLGGYAKEDSVFQVSLPVRYKKFYLKHYYTKSYEEYLQKVSRGWPDGNNVERLQNFSHFIAYSDSCSRDISSIANGVFSHPTDKAKYKELVSKYDVLYLYSEHINIYVIMQAALEIMSLGTNLTIFMDNILDDSNYNILLEYAIETGNKIILTDRQIPNYFLSFSKGNKDLYYFLEIS